MSKIVQIDLRGGVGHYKPIIKCSNVKKEIIEESRYENEREDDIEININQSDIAQFEINADELNNQIILKDIDKTDETQ